MLICTSRLFRRMNLLLEVSPVNINSFCCPQYLFLFSNHVRTYIKRKYPVYPDDKAPDKIKEAGYTFGKEQVRQVYVWGLAEHGALGIQRQMKIKSPTSIPRYLHRPIRLSFGESHKIKDIACGYGFTAFAVQSKTNIKVFGTGLNTDSQLGYQSQRTNAPLETLVAPVPIALPITPNSRIIALAAGRAHLLALVQKDLGEGGKVYALGNNAYGQCGRTITEEENYFGSRTIHCIENVDGSLIKDIKCGQDHSVFLSTRGEVFTCGWGADGQTGQGHYKSRSKPIKLEGDIRNENIVKIATAADCNLAINDKGELFGWGNSEYGQLLCGEDITQLHTPKHISIPSIGPVIDAVAGGSFCAVLNRKGEVWVWGFGLLGLGPEVTQLRKPEQIPPQLLGHTPFAPPGYSIVSLSCGLFHLAALSSNGDLFTWGRNKGGCLGLGHSRDQPFPLRVSVGVHVLKAACGVDHMAVLCKPFI